jgi:hypothetical protein
MSKFAPTSFPRQRVHSICSISPDPVRGLSVSHGQATVLGGRRDSSPRARVYRGAGRRTHHGPADHAHQARRLVSARRLAFFPSFILGVKHLSTTRTFIALFRAADSPKMRQRGSRPDRNSSCPSAYSPEFSAESSRMLYVAPPKEESCTLMVPPRISPITTASMNGFAR